MKKKKKKSNGTMLYVVGAAVGAMLLVKSERVVLDEKFTHTEEDGTMTILHRMLAIPAVLGTAFLAKLSRKKHKVEHYDFKNDPNFLLGDVGL